MPQKASRKRRAFWFWMLIGVSFSAALGSMLLMNFGETKNPASPTAVTSVAIEVHKTFSRKSHFDNEKTRRDSPRMKPELANDGNSVAGKKKTERQINSNGLTPTNAAVPAKNNTGDKRISANDTRKKRLGHPLISVENKQALNSLSEGKNTFQTTQLATLFEPISPIKSSLITALELSLIHISEPTRP